MAYVDTLYNKRDMGDANIYVIHPWKGRFVDLVNSLELWINTQQTKQTLQNSITTAPINTSLQSLPTMGTTATNTEIHNNVIINDDNKKSYTDTLIENIVNKAKIINPKDFSIIKDISLTTTTTNNNNNPSTPVPSANTPVPLGSTHAHSPKSFSASFTGGFSTSKLTSTNISSSSSSSSSPQYYFWIDMFSLPQRKIITKPNANWYNRTLLPNIGHIHHTLCVFQWKTMLTTSRLWCLYEIYASYKNIGGQFEIIMNREEDTLFSSLLLHDYETINTKLCTIDINKCFAHTESDALNIRDALSHYNKDFQEINKQIIDYLRLWLLIYLESIILQYQFKQMETSIITTCIAHILHQLNYDKEAELLYTLVFETRKILYGNSHSESITALVNLGLYYNDIENYSKAEPLFMEALTLRKEILSPDHIDTLQLLNTLGSLYHHSGKYSEAEKLYREAIEGINRVIEQEKNNHQGSGTPTPTSPYTHTPLDHTNTSSTELIKFVFMSNLASLLKLKGQVNEAEILFRQIVDARTRYLGTTHPDTIASISNLAMICKVQGKYAESEIRYREALKARITRFGLHDTDTLTLMHTLGMLVKSLGRYAEAEQICHEVLNMRRKVLGNQHPDTILSLTTVAKLLQALAQFPAAETLFREAIEIRKIVSGPSHNDTLILMNQLTILLRSIGRNNEAETLCKTTLQLRKESLGDNHTDTLVSMHILASIYQVEKKYSEAETLYYDILAKRRSILGNVHRDTLTALNDLGSLLLLNQKYSEAEPLFREAMEGRRQTLGSYHSDTLNSISNLATCLENLGRFNEAEPLFHEVVEAHKQSSEKAVPHIFVAKKHVAALVKNRRASASNIGPEAY